MPLPALISYTYAGEHAFIFAFSSLRAVWLSLIVMKGFYCSHLLEEALEAVWWSLLYPYWFVRPEESLLFFKSGLWVVIVFVASMLIADLGRTRFLGWLYFCFIHLDWEHRNYDVLNEWSLRIQSHSLQLLFWTSNAFENLLVSFHCPKILYILGPI